MCQFPTILVFPPMPKLRFMGGYQKFVAKTIFNEVQRLYTTECIASIIPDDIGRELEKLNATRQYTLKTWSNVIGEIPMLWLHDATKQSLKVADKFKDKHQLEHSVWQVYRLRAEMGLSSYLDSGFQAVLGLAKTQGVKNLITTDHTLTQALQIRAPKLNISICLKKSVLTAQIMYGLEHLLDPSFLKINAYFPWNKKQGLNWFKTLPKGTSEHRFSKDKGKLLSCCFEERRVRRLAMMIESGILSQWNITLVVLSEEARSAACEYKDLPWQVIDLYEGYSILKLSKKFFSYREIGKSIYQTLTTEVLSKAPFSYFPKETRYALKTFIPSVLWNLEQAENILESIKPNVLLLWDSYEGSRAFEIKASEKGIKTLWYLYHPAANRDDFYDFAAYPASLNATVAVHDEKIKSRVEHSPYINRLSKVLRSPDPYTLSMLCRSRDTKDNKILLTLGTYVNPSVSEEQIERILNWCSEIKITHGMKWCIKLHPNQSRDGAERMFAKLKARPDAVWQFEPLTDILFKSRVVVNFPSQTIFDTASAGLPQFVLDAGEAYRDYSREIKDAVAWVAENQLQKYTSSIVQLFQDDNKWIEESDRIRSVVRTAYGIAEGDEYIITNALKDICSNN